MPSASSSLSDRLPDPALIRNIFAYQQTKRLGLLLDQLSWSLDLDIGHKKTSSHLHDMLEEAKSHVMALAAGLKGSAS